MARMIPYCAVCFENPKTEAKCCELCIKDPTKSKSNVILCGVECFRRHVLQSHTTNMMQFTKRKTMDQQIHWLIVNENKKLDCIVSSQK